MTLRRIRNLIIVLASLLLPQGAAAAAIKHVIVIVMENTDAREIYGNFEKAPYINSALMPVAARSLNFTDPLPPKLHSEPHYVWMEAGTRSFVGYTFSTDNDPTAANSTGSTQHLVRQMIDTTGTANIGWMSYQQAMNAATGACPVASKYPYAAKHNPFVFFRDISGNPPGKNNALCAAHHRPYSSFAADLAANRIANYVFITPDLCHDMHNRCSSPSRITAGDSWLAAELPRMIDWANANSGVIFVVWDEGRNTRKLPFFAVGPGVRANFASSVALDHGSIIKSVETIFGLPILPAVANRNMLADMFRPGSFP